jgi:hypothetical protein
MERLESCWVGKVSIVGMRCQGNVGVCRIRQGKIRYEVVEAAVVSLPNECNLFEKFLAGLGCVVWYFSDEAKTEFPLRALSAPLHKSSLEGMDLVVHTM